MPMMGSRAPLDVNPRMSRVAAMPSRSGKVMSMSSASYSPRPTASTAAPPVHEVRAVTELSEDRVEHHPAIGIVLGAQDAQAFGRRRRNMRALRIRHALDSDRPRRGD